MMVKHHSLFESDLCFFGSYFVIQDVYVEIELYAVAFI